MDVLQQILREAVGIGLEPFEIVLAGVVELLLSRALQHFVGVFERATLESLLLFEHFRLGRFQDAIEPTEHCHGQHDFAVFGRAVGAAQKVRDVPDEAD